MDSRELANSILGVYNRQQVAISKLLNGELQEGEACDPDCQNYHSEGVDLLAKEIMRSRQNAQNN